MKNNHLENAKCEQTNLIYSCTAKLFLSTPNIWSSPSKISPVALRAFQLSSFNHDECVPLITKSPQIPAAETTSRADNNVVCRCCQLAPNYTLNTWVPFQYPIKRLIVSSRGISKPRDCYFKLSYRFEIWQSLRQQCCLSNFRATGQF